MATKNELIKMCEDLGIDTKALNTNKKLEDAITAKKAELAELPAEETKTVEGLDTEAGKEADEESEETAETEAKPSTVNKPVGFELNGRTYAFSELCPKTLQIDNEVYTQKEMLNEEDILRRLVVGNSPFVKRVR